VSLGDLLTTVQDAVAVTDDTAYKQLTVRTKGQGIAERGTKLGSDIGTKRQFRVRAGQLLVSRIDARNGAFGVVPQALDAAIITQNFRVFDINAAACLPRYLELLVTRPFFWDECETASDGSTNRAYLKWDEFLELEVPLPDVAEQQAIVETVTLVDDALRAVLAEASAAWVLLRSAVEALLRADAEWSDLPPAWSLATLGDVADVRSGITKGRKTKDPLRAVPFIRAANVQNGFLDLSEMKEIEATENEAERFRLEQGDLLLVEGSGSPDRLGRGWLWEGAVSPCLHQNHVFRARPNRELVVPRFLAYAVSSAPARAHFLDSAKTTSGLATINRKQTSATPVPVPPIAVQQRMVEQLDAIRRTAVAAQREASRLRDVRSALIDDLLSAAREAPQLSELPV
jgi:type I restriction enzyme S subunit